MSKSSLYQKLVIGALGTISKFLEKHLSEFNMEVNISQMQAAVLRNIAITIKNVLEF